MKGLFKTCEKFFDGIDENVLILYAMSNMNGRF